MINPEIVQRAKDDLQRKEEKKLCIDARICPDCGGKLTALDLGEGYEIVCKSPECSKVWDIVMCSW